MQEFFQAAAEWFVSLDEFWRNAMGGAFGAGCFWVFVAVVRRSCRGSGEVYLSPLATAALRVLRTCPRVPDVEGFGFTAGPLRVEALGDSVTVSYQRAGKWVELKDQFRSWEWKRVRAAAEEAMRGHRRWLRELLARRIENECRKATGDAG